MAQMHVDPSKVEELIKRFNTLLEETTYKEKQLKSFISNLQQNWNDAHYNAFLQQFQEFEQKFMRTIDEARTVIIPNLKNVQKLAEDYKNMGKR